MASTPQPKRRPLLSILALGLLVALADARAPWRQPQLFVAPLPCGACRAAAPQPHRLAPAGWRAGPRLSPLLPLLDKAEAEVEADAAAAAVQPPLIHRQHSIGGITGAGAFEAEASLDAAPAAPAAAAAAGAAALNATATAGTAGTAALEARVNQLEDTVKTVEKVLKRLELGGKGQPAGQGKAVGGIWESWRSKTVVINYDVGPDATIDSIDIAVAAAGVFGLLGMLVARSLARNLWLVGGIASAVLAGSLAREEEGGALSDVVRAVGFEVALKARQLSFMYRTGRLSYVYFKKWEQLDRRYLLTRKFEAVKALSIKKWREAEEAERKYQVRFRLMAALRSAYDGAVDTAVRMGNAKDRKELVRKMPKPLRYLFAPRATLAEDKRRRVRVTRFVGLRDGRPIVEVDDEK